MKKWIFTILVTTFLSTQMAQADMQVRAQNMNWRRNTAIVLFGAIGGGILGLSTLSFYGDPKEHTNNINMGALFGLMAGGSIVIYENAPRSQPQRTYNDYYGLFEGPESARKGPPIASVPSMKFEFTF
jgi:hypothetical protein